MTKKADLKAIANLRAKAKKLQQKASEIEKRHLCDLGKIVRKFLKENSLRAEDLPALNNELKQFLGKF